MTLNAELILHRYAGLRRAKIAAYEAAEQEAVARYTFETRRVAGLLDGTIAGRNETERDAKAREVLAEQWDELQMCGAEAREAKHHVDLAALAVDEVRALLRLAELAAYVPAGLTQPSHNGG